MLSDPQSITYAGSAVSLPAIGRSDTLSEYKNTVAGVVYDLQVSHSFKTRNRAVVRFQRTAAVTDPLVPAQNITASMTATLTVDFPTTGFTSSDADSLAQALLAWASTSGLMIRLCNGET
jgi:hypothetical protein